MVVSVVVLQIYNYMVYKWLFGDLRISDMCIVTVCVTFLILCCVIIDSDVGLFDDPRSGVGKYIIPSLLALSAQIPIKAQG